MRQLRAHAAWAAAFGVYGFLSLLLLGRGVVGSSSTRVVGDSGADKTLYMWALEWWPRSLRRGHNPLDVDVAWAPHGFDLGLATAGGGIALASAPLTAALGPVATYNFLILVAPALAATTAFVLASRVSGHFAPSLVAGYVFGFSSYEFGHVIGHLPLAFVALIPLVPYLVLRRHAGELSRAAFVTLFAAVLTAQFLIVPQLFFSLVVMITLAGVVGVAVLGLPALRRTIAEAVAGVFLAFVLVFPVVAYAVASDAAAPARSPFAASADVLNFVVPTRRTWLRPPGSEGIASRFTGAGAEQGAYLGLPFLVLAGLAALRRGAPRPRGVLVLVLLGAVVLSLGTRVKVAGEVVGIGPWAAVAPLPIVGSALPNRITVYTSLLAGLLIALALTDRRSLTRWAVVAAGVVATLPNVQLPLWTSDVQRPVYFARGGYERVLPSRSTALVLPYGPAGWSMLWHAESRFRFRLIGGHFGLRVTPPEREWADVYRALGTGLVQPRRLCSFLAAHGVDAVIVTHRTRRRMRESVGAAVGAEPDRVFDADVYDLGGGRCANPGVLGRESRTLRSARLRLGPRRLPAAAGGT